MRTRAVSRRSLAAIAVLGLVLSNFAALANAMAPAATCCCCNGVLCPMHHMGGVECMGGKSCSMRQCDLPPQALETAPFVLPAPPLGFLALAWFATTLTAFCFVLSVVHLPPTPPPRALPN